MSAQLVNYTLPSAALSTWIGWAKSARSTFYAGNLTTLDTASVMNYFKPFIIYLGIILFLLILTIFGGIMECACHCCCKKFLKKKQSSRDPPTLLKKTVIVVIFGVIYLLWLTGSSLLFSSSPLVSKSFASINSSTINTINSGQAIFNALIPTINHTIVTMQGYLSDDILAFVGVINITLVDITIVNNLIPIANKLNATQDNITSILAQSQSISANQVVLKNLFTSMETSYNDITASITDISSNTHQIGSTTYFWKKDTALSVPATLGTNLNNVLGTTFPNSTSILATLNGLDLRPFSYEIKNIAYSVSARIGNTIKDSAVNVTSDITIRLNSVNASISNSTVEYIDIVNSQANSAKNDVNSYLGMAITYDNYRNIGFILIAAIYLLIIIVEIIGLSLKKPRLTKGCNLTSTFFYVIIYLLGIIALVVTVLISRGCSWVFTDVASGPLEAAGLSSTINTVWDFRDRCFQNQSVIRAASDMGVFNSSQVNLTSLTKEKLDVVDYSSISNWNSSDSITLSDSPSNQVSGLTSVNTTEFEITSLNAAINTNIPNLIGDLTTLKATIDASNSSASVSDLTFTGGPGASDQGIGLQDYKSQLTTISTNIAALISLLNTQITGNSTLLRNQIIVIKDDSIASINGAGAFQGMYDNVSSSFASMQTQIQTDMTNYVPNFKSLLISQVSNLQNDVDVALSCYSLATDLYSVQDAFCGTGLSSLDAVWLSCIFLAVVSTLSMPLIVWGSNVLYPVGYNQIHSSEDEEDSTPRKKVFQRGNPSRIQKSGAVEDDEL